MKKITYGEPKPKVGQKFEHYFLEIEYDKKSDKLKVVNKIPIKEKILEPFEGTLDALLEKYAPDKIDSICIDEKSVDELSEAMEEQPNLKGVYEKAFEKDGNIQMMRKALKVAFNGNYNAQYLIGTLNDDQVVDQFYKVFVTKTAPNEFSKKEVSSNGTVQESKNSSSTVQDKEESE